MTYEPQVDSLIFLVSSLSEFEESGSRATYKALELIYTSVMLTQKNRSSQHIGAK